MSSNKNPRRLTMTDANTAALTAEDNPYDVTDTEVKGLILRVEKSGSKSYFLQVWTPDRAKRYRYRIGDWDTFRLYRRTPSKVAEREKSIRDVARQFVAKSLQDDLRDAKREARLQEKLNVTLEDFLPTYVEYSDAKDPATQAARIEASFRSILHKRLREIDHLVIRRWQKQSTTKAATQRRDLNALSGLLSIALRHGILERNILHKDQREKHSTSIDLPREDTGRRVRYLSEDERARLYAALDDRDRKGRAARARTIVHRRKRGLEPPAEITGPFVDYLTPLVKLALNTGLRRGELFGLTWDNLSDSCVTVLPETSKTDKGRDVILTNEARDIVRLWRRQTGGKGFVFTYRGEPLKRIDSAWRGLMKKAGLKDFTFHDCRHDFASQMMMKGASLYDVKVLLGHGSIAMTERYAHLSSDHLAGAINLLN